MGTNAFTSIWEGNDKDFLYKAIPFYLGRSPKQIVDVTWGSGKWWKACTWPVTGSDLRTKAPKKGNFIKPPFPNEYADVVVFDPPHLTQGGPNRSRLLDKKFSVTGPKSKSYLDWLEPALRGIWRITRPQGLVLVKIIDQVNAHRKVWQHVGVINIALDCGYTVCDLVIKVRSHGIVSSKWVNSFHALNRHSYWIVLRKSKYCEPK